MEAPGKYGQMIYTHAADYSALDVNLFASSELNWRDRGISVRQETQFPKAEKTRLVFSGPSQSEFTLRVRHPWWVKKGGLKISINGEAWPETRDPDGYAQIHRVWKDGDSIEVQLPMQLTEQTLPGDDHYVALMYGPIVLSGELGNDGLNNLDFWQINSTLGYKQIPESKVPTFIADTARDILGFVKPEPASPLVFWATGTTLTNKVRLVPFYENHFQRYALYWRRFSLAEQHAENERLTAAAEAQKKLDAHTIDRVQIGDIASEKAHNFQSLRSFDGIASYDTDEPTHWRDARDGGWFSYDLNIAASVTPPMLRCTYWGQEYGPRTFDVLVEGKVVKTTSLTDTGEAKFYNVDIPLAVDQLNGKKKITVKLQAHSGNTAGGLFDLRLLPSDAN
jgi:hypothetical protein